MKPYQRTKKKKGNGVTLQTFPNVDVKCGDPKFTLKWTYDDPAYFTGLFCLCLFLLLFAGSLSSTEQPLIEQPKQTQPKIETTNAQTGKTGDDLLVDVVLKQDTIGANERIGSLGTVTYPTAELELNWASPLPIEWTSPSNPNRVTNDGTKYTVRSRCSSLFGHFFIISELIGCLC